MKAWYLCLALACPLLGCAGAGKAPTEDPVKRAESGRVLRSAMELGRGLSASDPALVQRLEEASFAWLLLRGPAPMAGLRRLLDLKERDARDPLPSLFLASGLLPDPQALAEEEAFRSGAFFNEYDLALFRPFFRHSLLAVAQDPAFDEQGFDRELQALELGLKLTPRFAGNYPNQLDDALREDMQAYIQRFPTALASDRLRMLLAWDERNGAWAARREALDRDLRALAERSKDALLREELKDALAAPAADPERSFWWSLALPGSAQISHGDLQGGLLLGGLTLSAWIWLGAKLALAHAAEDDAARRVAYGDAAWAGTLALLGHGFTALNAAEQARSVNVVLQWDILAKDRLKIGAGLGSVSPSPDRP